MKEVNLKINADTKNAQKGINDLNKSVKDLEKSGDSLKEGFGEFGGEFGDTLNKAADGFTKLKGGVGMLTKSMGTLRGAIISTGIGALVVAVASLGAYFASTKEGADLFGKGMAYLKGVMQVLTNITVDLGRFLIKLFTEPKIAIQELGDFLEKFLVSRFNDLKKSFNDLIEAYKSGFSAIMKLVKGDFSGAMDEFGNAFKNAASSVGNFLSATNPLIGVLKDNSSAINDVAMAMLRLEERMQALQKLEVQDITNKAKLRTEINKLKLMVEDENTSLDDKINLLKEANKLEEDLYKIESDRLRERISIMEQTQGLGDNPLEDDRELAELKAKLIDLEGSYFSRIKESTTKIAGLRKEQERLWVERKKELEDSLKAIEDVINNIDRLQSPEKKIIITLDKKALDESLSQYDEYSQSILDKDFERAQQAKNFEKFLREEGANEAIKLATDINTIISNSNMQRMDIETARLQQKAADEMSLTGQVSKATLMAQHELEKAKEAERARSFKREKALNLVMGAINGAQAVIKGFAQGGPPMAIIAGIASAIQLAMIAKQKYTPGVVGKPSIPKPSVPSPPTSTSTKGAEGVARGDISRFKQQELYGAEKEKIGQGAGQNQRVYVLDRDIRETGRRVDVTDRNRTIG